MAELAGYISQSRPEPERAPYVQSIQQHLVVEEGQTPLSEDISRRREVFSHLLRDVKGLGEGAERGASHFSLLLGALPFQLSYNRDRGLLQLALCASIEFMAHRLLRNQKAFVHPRTHHHILPH
jgi:hypothetical protein